MAIGSILQIFPFDFKPSAPPAGQFILYTKTDNTIYIQDSSGIEYAFGSTTAITQVSGEASGVGPGNAVITLSNSAVIGKVLTGFTPGPNSVVLATDTIFQAIQKLQAQVTAASSVVLAGDVSGPSGSNTVNTVGGKSAASIATSVNDTQAATALNTASTLVERDASGDINIHDLGVRNVNATGTVTGSNLSGTNTGDITKTDSNTIDITLVGQNIQADVRISDATITSDVNGIKVGVVPAGNISGLAAVATSGNKTDVGLGNVDNTSDVNKPVSTAQQTAIDAKVSDIAYNQATWDNVTTIAPSKNAVRDQIESLITSISTKASLISPALTGTPTAPTASALSNSTQIATTAYVDAAISSATVPDATTTIKGIIKLAGDLSGTALLPTVSSVGGSSAANINSAELAANAATDVNTASTIVKRDPFGNLTAGTVTANLTGVASGNELPIVATTAADYYRGDKTFQPLNKAAVGLGNVDNTSDVNKPVSTAQALADTAVQNYSIQRANHTGTQLSSTISDFTEAAQDAVAAALTNTATINFTYNDPANTITANVNDGSITDIKVASGIDAIKIANGSVSNIEFQYLDGVTSAIQTQLNNKASTTHAATHLPSGSDPLATAAPLANLTASTSNSAGTAESFSKSDHSHAITTGAASTQTPDQTNAAGSSANLARADHVHNIPSGTPVQVGTSNFVGAAASFALSDHVHSHGNQTSGTLHAAATGAVNGFMSSTDKTKLDASTNLNTASAIVQRDASGNFSAGTITAALTGNVTGNVSGNVTGNVSGSSSSFTGMLIGDVTGTQGATVVNTVGGSTAVNIHSAELLTNAATNNNTPSTIVKRDSSGNFSAGTITANLTGNATNVTGVVAIANGGTNANNVNTARLNLGTEGRTTFNNANYTVLVTDKFVAQVGTLSAIRTVALPSASSVNSGYEIIVADESGTAGLTNYINIITTGLDTINAGSSEAIQAPYAFRRFISNGSSAWTFDGGVLRSSRNLSDLQSASTARTNLGLSNSSTITANSSNTPSTIVLRDSSGNFSAGTITASLTGNVSGSSGSFTGTLLGDVTGTQAATVVSLVGGKTASNVATSVNDTQAATSLNTASTIVKRNASGNFTAGAILNSLGNKFLDIANRQILDNNGKILLNAATDIPTLSVADQTTVIGQFALSAANKTAQFIIQNSSNTISASTDFIANIDTASDTNNYADFGINNSTYSDPSWTINGNGDAYLYNNDAGLAIGSGVSGTASNQLIKFFQGGSLATNLIAQFSASGVFQLGSQTGSSAVQLQFKNSNTGTLQWNPSASITYTLPPTQGGAGSYLSNSDGAGTLTWTNPLVNIDGGTALSNYTSAQVINGGNA